MQKLNSKLICLIVAFSGLTAATTLQAQGTPLPIELLPLGKDIGIASGQTVTPAYEGWYENDDGTLAISFGYYNRNAEEILEIPVGPANRIIGAPEGESDQGQPTHLMPGRHWGVFTVNVPIGYGEAIVWHLENQGKTFHIQANMNSDYVIDAIAGDANGNFPPQLRFQEDGPMAWGPAGTTIGPLQVKVGDPLSIDVWASDDGKISGVAGMFMAGNGFTPPIEVAWFKQQGPGDVEFSEHSTRVPSAGGEANTEVTFSKAGEYLLRVRVTDIAGPEMSGHSQCCWTNSFVKVSVSN